MMCVSVSVHIRARELYALIFASSFYLYIISVTLYQG